MTVSSNSLRTVKIVGTLRKDFNGRSSVWEFMVSDDGKFLAEGGLNHGRKVCKTRDELRHLWTMMVGYGYSEV